MIIIKLLLVASDVRGRGRGRGGDASIRGRGRGGRGRGNGNKTNKHMFHKNKFKQHLFFVARPPKGMIKREDLPAQLEKIEEMTPDLPLYQQLTVAMRFFLVL
jgi:hypothetical protein